MRIMNQFDEKDISVNPCTRITVWSYPYSNHFTRGQYSIIHFPATTDGGVLFRPNSHVRTIIAGVESWARARWRVWR